MQLSLRVHVALDDSQGHGPQLPVQRRCRHVAHGPHGTADLGPDLGAGLRHDVARPVEVQEDDPAGRLPQVVHAGDSLLSAVAALLQVDGGPQHVELTDERAVVDLRGGRTPRLHPQRIPRLTAGDGEVLVPPVAQD